MKLRLFCNSKKIVVKCVFGCYPLILVDSSVDLNVTIRYCKHTFITGDIIREHFYDVNGVDDRPDFYNFRCLLLETVLDAKSVQFTSKRFVLDLFLNFMKLVFVYSDAVLQIKIIFRSK